MKHFSEDYNNAKSNFEKEKEKIKTAALKEVRGLMKGETNDITENFIIYVEPKIKVILITPSETVHYFIENSDIEHKIQLEELSIEAIIKVYDILFNHYRIKSFNEFETLSISLQNSIRSHAIFLCGLYILKYDKRNFKLISKLSKYSLSIKGNDGIEADSLMIEFFNKYGSLLSSGNEILGEFYANSIFPFRPETITYIEEFYNKTWREKNEIEWQRIQILREREEERERYEPIKYDLFEDGFGGNDPSDPQNFIG
jgi:hypothetical protein